MFVKLPPRAPAIASANMAVSLLSPPPLGKGPGLPLWVCDWLVCGELLTLGWSTSGLGPFLKLLITTSYESFGPFSWVPTSSSLDSSGAASRWQDCPFRVWFLAEWGLLRLHMVFLRGYLHGITWHLNFKLSVVFQWNGIQPGKKPIMFINFSFAIVVLLWIL